MRNQGEREVESCEDSCVAQDEAVEIRWKIEDISLLAEGVLESADYGVEDEEATQGKQRSAHVEVNFRDGNCPKVLPYFPRCETEPCACDR